jgi:hypothetical protein
MPGMHTKCEKLRIATYFQLLFENLLVVGLVVAILNEWKEPPGRAICNKLAMGM